MFVDVLHHTEDPMVLLRGAKRVGRKGLIIKDHLLDGFMAGPTLRMMDTVGNARFGVALPHNYWRRNQWFEAFKELNLVVQSWTSDLKLYPRSCDWIFGRKLHFVTRLDLG
jgi:hypothetical protein